MEDAEIYRKFAADCVERAHANAEPDTVAGLLRLSQYWLGKALKAERTSSDGRDAGAHR